MTIKQFWDLVDKETGPIIREELGRCWVWKGSFHPQGYGQLTWKGKPRASHIVAWELVNARKLPKGTVTRHACDNRQCCNPVHLINGTHKENMADMKERGRASKGEGHARSVFTEEDIHEIMALIDEGCSNNDIASIFNVSGTAINAIRQGRSWSHVTGIQWEGYKSTYAAVEKRKEEEVKEAKKRGRPKKEKKSVKIRWKE